MAFCNEFPELENHSRCESNSGFQALSLINSSTGRRLKRSAVTFPESTFCLPSSSLVLGLQFLAVPTVGGGRGWQQVLEPFFQLFVSVTDQGQATVGSPWDDHRPYIRRLSNGRNVVIPAVTPGLWLSFSSPAEACFLGEGAFGKLSLRASASTSCKLRLPEDPASHDTTEE